MTLLKTPGGEPPAVSESLGVMVGRAKAAVGRAKAQSRKLRATLLEARWHVISNPRLY